jgi:hypothetical protein
MRRLAPSIVVALFASGCMINLGTRLQDVAVANAPAGTRVEVRLRDSERMVTGELLDVRDDALVVLSENRVNLIPLAMIRRAWYADASVVNGGGDTLGPEDRSFLRLYSRYPNGISPEVMARLLRALGQDAPRVPTG